MAGVVTDQEFLLNVFEYDPINGTLYSKETGRQVGYRDGNYLRIGIIYGKYWVHRVIWCMVKGYWPDYVDHRDGDGFNNRWHNLRECDQSQNGANSFPLKRGVEKHGRKYRARIWVKDIRLELGSYDTEEEAQAAYNAGATYHFGEFARCNRFVRRI